LVNLRPLGPAHTYMYM